MKYLAIIIFSILSHSLSAQKTHTINLSYHFNCEKVIINDSSTVIIHYQNNVFEQFTQNQTFKLPIDSLSKIDSISFEINQKKHVLFHLDDEGFEKIFFSYIPVNNLTLAYTDNIECVKSSANPLHINYHRFDYLLSWHYEGYCCEISIYKEKD